MRIEFLMFPGQGAQWVGMGKSWTENHPEVRRCFDEAELVLGYSLREICFGGPEATLTETQFCQPALYVLGYGIFKVLEQRGLLKELRYVLGLSLGELTALAAAGVFDFATGLRLVQARAQRMQKACEETDGGMLCFIGGQRENVERLCQTFDVDLSNRNCPGQIVVSGPKERLEALRKAAQTMGFRRIVPLQVAGAYHSRLMQKARDGFRKDLEKCSLNRPRYTVLSNVSGTPMDSRGIRQALEEQVVSTILWEPSLSYLHANGLRYGVECGSKNILARLAKRTHPDFSITVLSESEDLDKNA